VKTNDREYQKRKLESPERARKSKKEQEKITGLPKRIGY
jgi:hypothetical protein